MSKQQKSPDTTRLEEIIEQLESDYAKSESDVIISVKETEEIIEVLKWTCTFLNDRKLYHKTQQKKKAIIQKLIKEHLSEADLRQIADQAAKAATAEVE